MKAAIYLRTLRTLLCNSAEADVVKVAQRYLLV